MDNSDTPKLLFDKNYQSFLKELKLRITRSRIRAALAVNHECIRMYWEIGRQIIEKQKQYSWGSKFLEQLSHDLRIDFPESYGFSVDNLKRMRIFAVEYTEFEVREQVVPQLPWGHIILIMKRVKEKKQREWYAQQYIGQGWTRDILNANISQKLYERQAIPEAKTSNYLEVLPEPQSSLAHAMLKDPYNFDFLGLHDEALERDIENASIQHITKFLLELGAGFSFVGKQVPITLEGEDYFIDMLFYHIKLHCFIVCELKATKFKPEHAGQLNFYLNLVDKVYKTEQDNPSIGILLCKSNNKVVAEYALKGIQKPIGVSEYQLTKALPEKLEGVLPSIEELETELSVVMNPHA